MLIQEDLASYRDKLQLREVIGAGEPLNPEIIEQIQNSWGLTLRDGYGQTETCAQIGNSPGQAVKAGSMGKPLPGYQVALLNAEGIACDEGEVCLSLSPRPVGLMVGYADSPEKTAEVMRDGYYHCGDVAQRDSDGYITFVGRADDVFKSAGYRISPFEVESALIEHPSVVEVAVIPSPDPVRNTIPKAFVILAANQQPSEALAREILTFAKERLAPYKRVRRITFVTELPKTISGKIRRVQLRQEEVARRHINELQVHEYLE
jgi:acetyl-CoA synthetase